MMVLNFPKKCGLCSGLDACIATSEEASGQPFEPAAREAFKGTDAPPCYKEKGADEDDSS